MSQGSQFIIRTTFNGKFRPSCSLWRTVIEMIQTEQWVVVLQVNASSFFFFQHALLSSFFAPRISINMAAGHLNIRHGLKVGQASKPYFEFHKCSEF